MVVIKVCLICNSIIESDVQNCTTCGSSNLMKFENVNVKRQLKDVYLIRIKCRERLKELVSGKLYCNSPVIYKDYVGAGQEAIQDNLECLNYKRKLSGHEKEIIFKFLDNRIKPYGYKFISLGNGDVFFFDDVNKYRLYCFYSISVNENGKVLYKIDEGIRKFGESFVVINVHEYVKKIKECLPKNVSFEILPVKYVDYDSYEGPLDITCKDLTKYSYQREYRLIFYCEDFEKDLPLILDLPSLEDHASEIFDLELLFKLRNIKELGIG